MVGKGVEDYKVIEYSKHNSDWFFYVGNKFHEEKILHFSIADFQTIPGAVGLNIIDSFSFHCPLITTSIDNHGPEISYLENMENGIIHLITDNALKQELNSGCNKARQQYSIENMADNFLKGVLKIIK